MKTFKVAVLAAALALSVAGGANAIDAPRVQRTQASANLTPCQMAELSRCMKSGGWEECLAWAELYECVD